MGDFDAHPLASVEEKTAAVTNGNVTNGNVTNGNVTNGNGVPKSPTRPQLKSGSSHANMNGPLYMQSGKNVVLVRRLKRKDQGVWKFLAQWLVENQTGLSFNLLALLFLAHAFIPKARTITHKFFHLSYYNPKSGEYGVGIDDTYLILFCIVLFTGLRAGTMESILAPLGKLQGITNRKELTRFTEQGWMIVYYTFFWSLGVYLYATSPYFLNLKELWTNWPNRELSGIMKAYILAQWAFWLQQIIVTNIEERRKDHWQMMSHHFVTSALICACYSYHFTRVGTLILVLMDIGDLQLGLAKCLKYSGFTNACDYAFGVFMVTWLALRHVSFMMVCWSIYRDTPVILPTGCFRGTNDNLDGPLPVPTGYAHLIEPFISSTGRVCYDSTVMWSFLLPLLFLQVLLVIWFAMIVRVAVKVIRGDGAEDNRSDDEAEDEEEEEDEFIYEEAEALQEEVGADSLDWKSWERRNGVKIQASSSGVSLPGHSDRKELLGRIGCEKQVE